MKIELRGRFPVREGEAHWWNVWRLSMIFIVKKASDHAFEEKREIYSITALVELADGLEHDLVLSRNLLRDHPVILVCDGPME
jgi:hypothetical protein